MKLENRNRQLDVLALALMALTLFAGLSLVTYHKADPPGGLVYPAASTVQNACGKFGAAVAHFLFESLGLGAFYALGSLAVVTTLLLARRNIDQPALRTAGWIVSLIGFASLAALVLPNWTPGPIVGAGGYVGAMGQAWLESRFAHAGSMIFAGSVLAAGLLLCTDYLFLQLAAATTQLSGRSLANVGRAATSSLRPKTDLEDEFDEESEEAEAEDEDEEYDYEDEDEWEEEDYEDEEDEELTVKTPSDKVAEKSEATSAGGTLSNVANKLAEALKGKPKQPAEEKPAKEDGPKFVKPKPKSERDEIIEKLDAADHDNDAPLDYELPDITLLSPPEDVSYEEHEKEVRRKAKVLEKTFKNFGFNVRVVEIETGPVISPNMKLHLAPGLAFVKRSPALADDLAIAMRVPSVRIVAPIPGKNSRSASKFPTRTRQVVRLRDRSWKQSTAKQIKKMKIPLFLGKPMLWPSNPLVV